MTSNYEAVHHVLVQYYDGLYTCDTALLKNIFHPNAQYCTASSGTLLHLDMPSYFDILKDRTSPQSKGDTRFLDIESIEFAGPATAFCRLRCQMLDNAYTDFLTLIKLEDRWQIISKVFHVESRANTNT